MEFEFGQYKLYALLFIFGLITAEIIWSWRKDKKAYGVKDTLANLSIFAGFQLLDFPKIDSRLFGRQFLKQAFQRIDSFVFLSPEKRYQQYLKDYPNIINRAPDKYIANVLGITPVSLSRIRQRISKKKN